MGIYILGVGEFVIREVEVFSVMVATVAFSFVAQLHWLLLEVQENHWNSFSIAGFS